MKKIFLISAIVVLALAAAGAVYAFSPAGHLSIDVNPSFELTFNRVNRVVKVQGLNPEAKALLANNEFHGDEVDDVVEAIIEKLLESGYLKAPDARLLLSADDSSFSKGVLKRVNYSTIKWLKEYYENTEVLSQIVELDDDALELAHKAEMSFGRLALLQHLFPGKDADFFTNMTIKEAIEFARANNIDLDDLFDDDDGKISIDLDDLFDDDMDDDDDDMDDDIDDDDDADDDEDDDMDDDSGDDYDDDDDHDDDSDNDSDDDDDDD